MNRRHLLAALGGATSAGCLTFTESVGTDTPTDGTDGPRDSDRELVEVSTAAEAVEVRSWDVRTIDGVADRDAYAVATDIPVQDDSIRLYEYDGYGPRWESSVTATWKTLELGRSSVYAAGGVTGSDGRSDVYRLDRQSGAQRARRRFDGDANVLIAAGDLLVCTTHEAIDGRTNRYRIRVHGLDPGPLTERWVQEFQHDTFPVDGTRLDGTIHLGFADFFVGLGAADGTRRYRTPVRVHYPTTHEGALLAATNGQLRRIDPETLDYEWSVGSDVMGRPIVVEDIVAVPTTNGVLAANATDGELLWHRELESDTGYTSDLLGYHAGLLWFGAADDVLYGLLPRTGETAFSMSTEMQWLASSANGVVVAADESVSVYTVEA